MLNVNIVCFSASYIVAFGLELSRLYGRTALSRAVMILFALAGFVAHTMYLIARSNQAHLPPLLSSTHDWLLVLAWMALLFYLFLSLVDRGLPSGLFLLPVVLLLISFAYLVSDGPDAVAARGYGSQRDVIRSWAILHASLLAIGFVGVIIAFVLSMMYLVQHSRLKHKQALQNGIALPSLARLAKWNWWATVISVPLLTLGMATGGVLIYLSREAPDAIWWNDPIIVGSCIAWIVMTVFFGWLIWTPRAAGKQVAWLTICALGFALVTSLGLLVATGGHEPSTFRKLHLDAEPSTSKVGQHDKGLLSDRSALINAGGPADDCAGCVLQSSFSRPQRTREHRVLVGRGFEAGVWPLASRLPRFRTRRPLDLQSRRALHGAGNSSRDADA